MTTLTRWLVLRISFRRWAPRAAVCTLLILGLVPIRGQRYVSGEIEIRQALEKLGTLGSVMMIGAHPDDEREQVLAYLALGRHVRTAYLSLTRGEGGQNLIGPEQRIRAAGLVSDGATVSIAHPVNTVGDAENTSPANHFMTRGGDVA